MAKLDKSKIPTALHDLISFAEEWGINDDSDRARKVAQATADELRALVSSIDSITDDDLYGWLQGPESSSPMPSDEYVSFTCLTMAIDAAKLKLKRLVKN